MQVTVGISPGSRNIGVVVLRRKELVAWRVQTLRGRWTAQKGTAFAELLSNLFASYDISSVSVKIPDVLPTSFAFCQALGILNIICERKGMRAIYYTLSDIKRRYEPKGQVTKEAIVAHLVRAYPELLPEYRKEQNSDSAYYTKIFEALAAVLCTYKIENQTK